MRATRFSLLLGLVTVLAMLLSAAPASADSSSTLTVVGTSDVSDSGLIANLIQPQFAKAYPQFTFKYIGTATGTAISDAESGAVGASALIVHAASLENQFVANGYSYERYGRAIFTNDFVLAGPKADPAGVAGNGAHDVAQAFADVAASGISGKATFVSRGGTPGTTVQEHQIWALVGKLASPPAGLLLCAVSSTSGGGETPIAPGNGITASGQPCPNGGALPAGTQLPPWYVATGVTQGPNVVLADACNGYPSGANSCYVLSDRGTYDYLASGADPAGAIQNLMIVTRDDSASAPGGADALINYFHAYVINPAKPGESVNLTAAKDFADFLTSPAFQAQLSSYLAKTSDPGGAPFKADASPIITATGIPANYRAGKPVTVTGTVVNAEPGYLAPAGQPVSVDQIVGTLPVPVASGKTSTTGTYSISFTPSSSGSYEVSTPQLAQIENTSLSPVFGDLLSPGASTPMKVTVQSAITKLTVSSEGPRALVVGAVAPGAADAHATVTVLARPAGSKHGFKLVGRGRLNAGEGNFALAVALAPGRWQLKVAYSDPRQVLGASSPTRTVTIGTKPVVSLGTSAPKLRAGSLTLAGSVRPASARGAAVVLRALNTTAGSPPRFAKVGAAKLATGRTSFTLHAKLRRGSRWILLVEYVENGRAASFSALRAVTVR